MVLHGAGLGKVIMKCGKFGKEPINARFFKTSRGKISGRPKKYKNLPSSELIDYIKIFFGP